MNWRELLGLFSLWEIRNLDSPLLWFCFLTKGFSPITRYYGGYLIHSDGELTHEMSAPLKNLYDGQFTVSAMLIKTNHLGRSTTISLETNLFITVSLKTNSLYHSFSFVKQPYPVIFRNWNMTNWTSISFWDQSLRQVIFQSRSCGNISNDIQLKRQFMCIG